jgi:hypothetical protein
LFGKEIKKKKLKVGTKKERECGTFDQEVICKTTSWIEQK